MSTTQSIIDLLLDQLSDCASVTVRKMFGEYCVYEAGRPIGLVCNNQLYLKDTAAARALMADVVEAPPYPGAKPHLLLTADQWDDRQNLCRLVRITADALPPPKPKKSAKAKKPRESRTIPPCTS